MVKDRAAQLGPLARSDRMLLGMCLEPALALDYAQAHICLTHIGYPHEAFDRMLRAALSSQAAGARERPPHRMLEQAWALELWKPTGVARPAVTAQTAVNMPPDLLSCTRDDGYAFTHALMYTAEPEIPQWRLPRPRATILAETQALLAWCLDEQDYDLGGELLLAWPLTGRSWGAGAIFGLHVLAAVEDMVGFLPSPATRLEQLSFLAGEERTQYLYATAYHTMYVMGLLCAAALRPGCQLPRRVPTKSGPAIAPELLGRLRGGPEKHWQAVFEAFPPAQRESLSGVLLAMALRRAAKARDYGELQHLLRFAQRHDLADAPIASQAAELLERVALFAQLSTKATNVDVTSL